MKLFDSNPYRVLGIKANASAPERQKTKAKMAAYLAVGKDPILDFDLCPPLKQITRTQELIDLKSNTIHSDEDKVKHALFWFVSGGTIDDIALSNLTQSKDIHKALLNFEKGARGFRISKNSICSIVNHSSLEIICYPQYKDRDRLKSAISQKLKIAGADNYLSMLLNHLNPDQTRISSSVIKSDILTECKNLLIDIFGDQNTDELFLEFFSGQKEVIQEIVEKKNKDLIQSIRNYLALSESRRDRVIEQEYGKPILIKCAEIGNEIIDRCVPLLLQIKKSCGVNDNRTQNIYEEVFAQINFCSVLSSNKFAGQFRDSHDQEDFVKTAGKTCHSHCIKLLNSCKKYIKDISFPTKRTIENNIEALNEGYENWKTIFDNIKEEEERRRIKKIERERRNRQRREQEKRDRIRAEKERKKAIIDRKRREQERKEKEQREAIWAIVIALVVLGVLYAIWGWTGVIVAIIIVVLIISNAG